MACEYGPIALGASSEKKCLHLCFWLNFFMFKITCSIVQEFCKCACLAGSYSFFDSKNGGNMHEDRSV